MTKDNLIEPTARDGNPFIFVSYAHEDMDEVQYILKILEKNHYSFWYDRGVKSGVEWAEELGEKIIQSEQFMVLISPKAVISKFVRKEVEMAVNEKPQGSICVLYLRETILSSGLKYLLGGIQAFFRYQYHADEAFARAICEEMVSKKTLMALAGDKMPSGIARMELENNYEVLKLIGRGGLGRVYLGVHRRTKIPVAIKSISFDGIWIHSKVYCAEERIILGKILKNSNPFVPSLLDWYEDEKNIFMVETYFSGQTLDIWAKEKNDAGEKCSESEVVEIAIKILHILDYVHKCGVIYGDVKPNNIIRNEQGEIFIIDFNSAICETEGIFLKMATNGFSPPEQYHSKISFSSDIYALGRTMIWLLCGEIMNRSNLSLKYYRKDISAGLEDIICKMTDENPDFRYQTAQDVIDILENYKKINILARINLYIKSKRREKTYSKINNEYQQKYKKSIEEMAQLTTSCASLKTTVFINDEEEMHR